MSGKASRFVSEQLPPVLGLFHMGALIMGSEAWWHFTRFHDAQPLLSTGLLLAAITALLWVGLRIHAREGGHAVAWGLFAMLGLIGVIVLYCLPDRPGRPARGFAVEPVREQT